MLVFTLLDPHGNPVGTPETVTVNGNGLYTTPTGFTLPTDGTAVAGVYQWNVGFVSGHASNSDVTLDNDPTERVTVNPASPTVKTTADPSGTIPLNSTSVTLTDTATLEGGYFPGGSITFTLDFNGAPVQGFPVVETVSGNGDYHASFTLPTTGAVTGAYTWYVHYSGDANNIAADDQRDIHEQVTIDPATPTLFTIASPAITLGTTAPTLSDTAVLSGGFHPTGTLVFTLTGPGVFSFTTDVTVNGNGTYTASTPLPTAGLVAGTYTWRVHYTGDHNNNPADDEGAPIEQTVVDPAAPSVVTTADPTGTIQLGSTPPRLTDSAVLSGGYFPAGGILSFKLFFNDGSTLTDVYSTNVTVNGNGTYTTSQGDNPGGFILPTTGLVAGTYGWFVGYSGDDNNIAADDQGGPAEQVVVIPASPTLTTTPNPTSVTLGATAETLTDAAVLAGGFNPTGTITFTLLLGSTLLDTEMVAVNGNGTYPTPTGFLLPAGAAAGTYQWNAVYGGDSNNSTVSDVNNVNEQVTVGTVADLALVKQVSPGLFLQGSDVTYTFILHNNGPSAATNVTVTDPFPAGLTVVGPNTPSQGIFDAASGVWTVGTLDPGVTATLTVTARIDVLGPITNTAHAGTDTFDPDLSNNTGSVTITGQMPPGDISKRFFLAGGAITDTINLAALSLASVPLPVAAATPTTVPDVARQLAPIVTTALPKAAAMSAATTTVAPAAVATSNPAVAIPVAATGPGLLVGGGGGTPDTTTDTGDIGPKPLPTGSTRMQSEPGEFSALDQCLAAWGRDAAMGDEGPVRWWLDDPMSDPDMVLLLPDGMWDAPVRGELALCAIGALL
jgi:uncharacterized repeat protein (TIGR01451 family)